MKSKNFIVIENARIQLENISHQLGLVMKQDDISATDFAEVNWLKAHIVASARKAKELSEDAYYSKYKEKRKEF